MNFRGRARRKEYWSLILFVIITIFITMSVGDLFNFQKSQYLLGIPFVIFFLPVLSAGVRRMHDIGKSGTTLLVYFIPLIGGIWLLILLFTESQKGTNRHGPNPKNPILDDELDLIGSE
jgi:uncharacterized membrane protein YhaH (DUF805 family)